MKSPITKEYLQRLHDELAGEFGEFRIGKQTLFRIVEMAMAYSEGMSVEEQALAKELSNQAIAFWYKVNEDFLEIMTQHSKGTELVPAPIPQPKQGTTE